MMATFSVESSTHAERHDSQTLFERLCRASVRENNFRELSREVETNSLASDEIQISVIALYI